MRKITLFAVGAVLLSTVPATAQNGSFELVTTDPKVDAPIVSLSLTGTARAKPDRAMINAGVQSKAVSAADAMAQNARQMQAVLSALKAGGVSDKDIQTSSINLNQDYDYTQSGQLFKGYIASNNVSIRMKDIGKMGYVLDTLVRAGATNINGPSFMVEDDSALSTAARTDAMKQAANLSTFYAKNAGYARARLISITEGADNSGPMPVMNMKMEMAEAGGASTPVEAGEVTKAITVTVKYILER